MLANNFRVFIAQEHSLGGVLLEGVCSCIELNYPFILNYLCNSQYLIIYFNIVGAVNQNRLKSHELNTVASLACKGEEYLVVEEAVASLSKLYGLVYHITALFVIYTYIVAQVK